MKKNLVKMKIKFIIMLFILVFAGQVLAADCGDVNTDGVVDIVDALLIAQDYVGLNPANFDSTVADVNNDSSIDIVDALLIAQLYVGLIDELNCQDTPTPTPTTAEPETVFAVNCGGNAYTASDGTRFAADTGFSGGTAYDNGASVSGTSDPTLYSTERYGSTTYSATVPNGDFLVTLYFAENYHTSSGSRIFNVRIEGAPVISNLDIYARAGSSAAYVAENQVTVSDGEINIEFVTVTENALINAIKIDVTAYSGDPVAVFTVSPANPEPGNTVTVDASASYDPDGSITQYQVNYGDGYTTNGAVTSHQYTTAGTYTITVTVTDNEGKIDTEEKTIYVGQQPLAACELGRGIANRIANNTLNRHPTDTYYAHACVWYGTLVYAGLTGNSTLINGSTTYYPGSRPTGSVDDNIFGIWGLGLYEQTNNTKARDDGLYLADEEYNPPNSGGLCKYTRYWVDDLYMICSLQIQAYKATGNTKYLDRCKLQFEAYFTALQKSNGLFHHTRNAPYFWGRGNGWAASAMTEALMVWPEDYPGYDSIMRAYTSMMAALKTYQDSTGMWHQVITNSSAYLETSCTGMFLFAIATGVRMGWLPANEYLPVAERGINALNGYVNSNGEARNICIGTGEGSNEQFYLDRPTSTGDFHGQAGALWGATAVMRLCK
ncbi:MAG: glycoside hydrolase family 88 protein [Spirochaetales bacterium]|nr:glycoside hydrolase family 88 protein [Spirochaetales bacterium]